MKTVTIQKTHHLSQLTDELFDQFPAWRTQRPDGLYQTDVAVGGDGETVTLTLPDDADEVAIRAAVTAHVANPDYTPQPAIRQAKRYLRNTIWPLFRDNKAVGNLQPGTPEYNMHKSVLVLIANLYDQD